MSDTTHDAASSQQAPVTGVRLRIFGRTDVGMVREHNEDNFLIADLSTQMRNLHPEVRTHIIGPRGTIFAVCDGMGGAAAGEVASQMAVDTIYDIVQNGPAPTNRDQFAQRLSFAICEAGARIFLAAKSNRAQRGMGTTSTVAGAFGRTLFVGQVGDSRAYLFRQGRIKQITKDQSLVSKLIEAGQLTEAEAETYEHSHIILQALGTADTVSVDLSFIELCRGDAVLLCSDGLSGLVSAEQMREVLATIDEPMECCKRLTELANAAGGHDNITVIVGRFDGDLPEVGPEDEHFGYQPYVITEPLEQQAPVARASGRIKGADAPPPGKDVKNAVSMRPPAMAGVAPAAVDPAAGFGASIVGPVDDPIVVPMNNAPRLLLVALLITIAAGAIAAAVWLVARDRGGTRAEHLQERPSEASASSSAADGPTTVLPTVRLMPTTSAAINAAREDAASTAIGTVDAGVASPAPDAAVDPTVAPSESDATSFERAGSSHERHRSRRDADGGTAH